MQLGRSGFSVLPIGLLILPGMALADQACTASFQLGRCLAGGCVVYSGTVIETGPMSFEAGLPRLRAAGIASVTLGNVRVVYAPDSWSGADQMELERYVSPAWTKSGLGPWVPWINIDPQTQETLTIIERAGKPQHYGGRDIRPIELVTSSEADLAIFEVLADQHQQYIANPSSLPLTLNSPDVKESSYLCFAVGWLSILSSTRPTTGPTLIQLLGHSSIHESLDRTTMRALVGCYRDADSSLRGGFLTELFRRSLDPDDRKALASLTAVARMTAIFGLPEGFVPDASLRTTAGIRYRALSGRMSDSESTENLEKLLGVEEP